MRSYQNYLFDLDGTVYLGEELLPGAAETIRELQNSGAAIRYVTNNPTRHPGEYAEKLTSVGISTSAEEIVTSVSATIKWLVENAPGATVFPIGEAPLVEALEDAGIPLCEDAAEIDIVLASFDRTFAYDKLQIAFDALWFHRRATLMSTNPDRFCPYPGGRGEPDAAAIVGALEASTGVTLQQTFGKPGPMLARMALESIGGTAVPGESIMVGDRLETDIAMGVNAGLDTALVLTGDSTREDIPASGVEPTWVLESLVGLLQGPAPAAAPQAPQGEGHHGEDHEHPDRDQHR